jgi:hypothetical protein
LKVHAHSADHELAAAIRGAVGEVSLAASGHPPGGAQPRSWQDMLLPRAPQTPGVAMARLQARPIRLAALGPSHRRCKTSCCPPASSRLAAKATSPDPAARWTS